MLSQNHKKKIIIGSAQFLTKYGITNRNQIPGKEVDKIVRYLYKNNCDDITIDSASSYGNLSLLGNLKLKKKI